MFILEVCARPRFDACASTTFRHGSTMGFWKKVFKRFKEEASDPDSHLEENKYFQKLHYKLKEQDWHQPSEPKKKSKKKGKGK